MDDKLIAQVKATAQALRDAVTQTERELADAHAERAAIDARIDQLDSLLGQLNGAAEEAEATARSGAGGRGATKRGTAKRSAAKKTAKRTAKKATAKKATAKKAATPVKARPVLPPSSASS